MRGAVVVAAAALAAMFAIVAAGAASRGGQLDPSFGDAGRARIDLGAGEYLMRASVLDDGRIVAAGSIGSSLSSNALVVRLNADGTLDPSFDGDGRAAVEGIAWRTALAVQRDGKIVLAGVSTGSEQAIHLVRLNADGSRDTSFGGSGDVRASVGGFCAPYHVLLTKDGKILVIGQTDAGRSGNSDLLALRVGSDGTVDSTFGNGGYAVWDWGRFDVPAGAALAEDGRIVVGGFSEDPTGANPVAAVGRMTADGKPDASFGDGGVVRTDRDAFNMGGGVAVQTDGKVLLAAGVPFAVLRLTQAGSPDATFAQGGWWTAGKRDSVARAVAVQRNGKIGVLGRESTTDGHAVFVLRRLLPNGVEDATFEGATPDVAGQAFPEFAHVAADGRIVAGGWTYGPGTGDLNTAAVFRYLPGTCSVPRLGGRTVATARTILAAANCRLGDVKAVRSKRVPKGRIVEQKPPVGREAADWAVVAVTVSRGAR